MTERLLREEDVTQRKIGKGIIKGYITKESFLKNHPHIEFKDGKYIEYDILDKRDYDKIMKELEALKKVLYSK